MKDDGGRGAGRPVGVLVVLLWLTYLALAGREDRRRCRFVFVLKGLCLSTSNHSVTIYSPVLSPVGFNISVS